MNSKLHTHQSPGKHVRSKYQIYDFFVFFCSSINGGRLPDISAAGHFGWMHTMVGGGAVTKPPPRAKDAQYNKCRLTAQGSRVKKNNKKTTKSQAVRRPHLLWSPAVAERSVASPPGHAKAQVSWPQPHMQPPVRHLILLLLSSRPSTLESAVFHPCPCV